jgi:septal ring factor EnvC (AmiA/AmiB activator)
VTSTITSGEFQSSLSAPTLFTESKATTNSVSKIKTTEPEAADTESAIADTESAIADTESAIADTESAIADTESAIADTESAIADTESADTEASETLKNAEAEKSIILVPTNSFTDELESLMYQVLYKYLFVKTSPFNLCQN